MTPTQFKKARKKLGLSQSQMANALGLKTARAIRHYEAGEREISGPIIKLVNAFLRGGNVYEIDASNANAGAVKRIEDALLKLAGPGVMEGTIKIWKDKDCEK